MTRIGEKYREAALALVAKAYSTIRIADLAVYLGQVIARTKAYSRLKRWLFSSLSISQTEAEAGAQVATLGWSQESGVVSFCLSFLVCLFALIHACIFTSKL